MNNLCDTVLSFSLCRQTRRVGSVFISKPYTICVFYSVQHSTVCVLF